MGTREVKHAYVYGNGAGHLCRFALVYMQSKIGTMSKSKTRKCKNIFQPRSIVYSFVFISHITLYISIQPVYLRWHRIPESSLTLQLVIRRLDEWWWVTCVDCNLSLC